MGSVRFLGYTRVGTASQDAQLQLDTLDTVGVQAGRVLGCDLGQQERGAMMSYQ